MVGQDRLPTMTRVSSAGRQAVGLLRADFQRHRIGERLLSEQAERQYDDYDRAACHELQDAQSDTGSP